MKAADQHNHMALLGLRLLVQFLGMCYGIGAGGLLWCFGFHRQALSALILGNLIAYLFAPDKEQRALYVEFQTKRLPPQP